MSRGDDEDRDSRSDEPPQLATVRRLHRDDGDRSSATATEEWYETERLTGHITGGARSAPPIDPPTPAQDHAPVVLDWRYAAAEAPQTALQRLRQTLAAHHYRGPRRDTQDAEPSSARARGAQRAAFAAVNQIESPRLAPHGDEPAADKICATGPSDEQLGLRVTADRAPNRRERSRRPPLRWPAIASAVVLSLAAVTVTRDRVPDERHCR